MNTITNTSDLSTSPIPTPGRRRSGLRRLATGLMASVAFSSLVLMNPSPASAAGVGSVSTGGNWSLTVRSAPTTGSAAVRSLANGSRVTLECWVRGQAVAGRWGTTTLWHRAAGGYISDGYVYTGVNGPASGEPACSTATAPSPAPAPSSRETRALTWARGQLGRTGWDGWCDRFVANAYGRSNSGYATAYSHYQELARRGQIHTTGMPPAGALVFYARARVNGYAGHVQLSEGNGNYITTAPTVRRVNWTWPGSAYIGWSYANSEWAGR